MRSLLMSDSLNQLHWTMLKSILVILALIPISNTLVGLLATAEGSSQIMIGFFTLSMMSASCILAFIAALKSTVIECDLVETKAQKAMFKVYRQIPMVFFVSILMYLISSTVL